MKHVSPCSAMFALALMTCAPALRAEIPACANAGPLERSPYTAPYAARADWFSELEKTAGVEVIEQMAKVFDSAQFDRFVGADTVRVERLRYRSDGLAINGFALLPNRADKALPVVVFHHGGVAQWGRILLADLLEMHRLAEQGYVVLASAFRGEGGSEGQADLLDGDVRDVLHLLCASAQIPQADRQRVGQWGFSRGANLAYRFAARYPGIRASVVMGSPVDALTAPRRKEFETHVYPHFLPGFLTDPQRALEKISPLRDVPALRGTGAWLLMHGGADTRVPVQDSLRMALALQAEQLPVSVLVLSGDEHAMLEHRPFVRQAMDAFFAEHLRALLKDAPAPVWLAPVGEKP